MSEERDNADCIVARTPCCKRLIFATVNDGRKLDIKTKREIADMVIEGYTLEHMTAAEVRKSDWGCECKKPAFPKGTPVDISGLKVMGKLNVDNPTDPMNRSVI